MPNADELADIARTLRQCSARLAHLSDQLGEPTRGYARAAALWAGSAAQEADRAAHRCPPPPDHHHRGEFAQ